MPASMLTMHGYHPSLEPLTPAGTQGQWAKICSPRSHTTPCAPWRLEALSPIVTGGPNCRTWSILRWFPKPGAPKPVRGRSEEQVWGLPGLTPRDQEDVDNDSTLLLRQMYLTSLAYQGVASQTIPHCPGSFLEHPSDPKETSKSPNAHRCSTIWNTKAYQHWAKTLRHRQVKFDQCQLGQLVAKSTTLSTDLDLGHWTGMICDHPGHPKLADIASSDLSRYPWKMMKGLAQAIAIRARPILQNPTPGLQVTTQFELGQHQPMKGGDSPAPTRSMYTSQSSPAGMTPEHTTSTTRSNPATKEPPALSGKGSLETPSHRSQGSKRSPSRSPAQHRASKGLKALSLLTSGTHTKADNNAQQPPTTTWTEESTSLWTPISMEQLMRTSDRPLVEPLANDIHLFDDIVMLHVAFKSRPLRDGGGKPSPGRLAPPRRAPVLPMVPQTIWSAQCGEKEHPFPEELLNTIRTTLGSPPNAQPPPGQPLFLELIQDLANRSGDPDWAFPTDLSQGVPLGVTTPPLHSPGIWPLKSELKGMEFVQQELEQPTGLDNYSSVKDFAPQVRATFVEEVQLGMVEGPLTKQQAALRCSCREEDLCPGPLAAIDEGDKIRTIYDGSAGGANIHIQNQTMERTTAPTVLDCVQVLHCLHEASNSQPPTVPHVRDEPTEA